MARTGDMRPARILVIEDENKTAAFLSKGLREAGFAVEVASDGETGLELARTTKSATADSSCGELSRAKHFCLLSMSYRRRNDQRFFASLRMTR